MTRADYVVGVDRVPWPHRELVKEAFRVWLADREYELSERQMSVAFFAAAKTLKLLEVTP